MKKIYTFLTVLLMAVAVNAQITLVKDINPGTGNASPADLTVFNNAIFFRADDAAAEVDHGVELWMSDGTETGTVLVKDLNESSTNSTPGNFLVYNNEFYFTALVKTWKTDGTAANTVEVIAEGMFWPQVLNGKVYYVQTVGGANNLKVFDGVTVADVLDNSGVTEKVTGGVFTVFNNKLLCYLEVDAAIGLELYEYDPATGLFTLIKDIATGDANSGITNFTVIGSKVYFEADALYETDGTPEGTVPVAAASSLTGGVTSFFAWNDKLYFEGDDGVNNDQLYVYDPAAGTLTNLSQFTSNFDPDNYCALGDYLYFSATDGTGATTTKYLWRTNGTTTQMVENTVYDIDDIVALNGKLYFEGDNGTTGNELFMVDPADITTSLPSQPEGGVQVSVYPNPTRGTITLSGLQTDGAAFELLNLAGQTVDQGVVSNQRIAVNAGAGVYILRINDGGNRIVKKITVL